MADKAPVGVTTTQLGRFQELNGEPMVNLRGRMVPTAKVLALLDAVERDALADGLEDAAVLYAWAQLEPHLRG